jgi:hypothetical protein
VIVSRLLPVGNVIHDVGDELRLRERSAQYLSSTFIQSEESCFYWFEGDGADDVRRACDEARVSFARIVETHDLSPDAKEKT